LSAVIFLILVSCGIRLEAKTFRFDYQKSIEIAGNVEFFLSNIEGRIEIIGGPGEQIQINAVKYVQASDEDESEELGANIEIRVTRNDNRVSVQTDYLRDSGRSRSFWSRLFGSDRDTYGSVDYSIAVPRKCRVEIDNTAGEILIDNIAGDLYINAMAGDIRLTGIKGSIDIEKGGPGEMALSDIQGDISLSSTESSVSLESLTGSSDIRLTAGDVRGSAINGAMIITQSSGEIILRRLLGDLRIRSNAGTIEVEQDSGAVDIVTQNGDITIETELKTYKDSIIRTTTGRILYSVPGGSAGTLRLETGSGEIKTDLKLAVRSISKNRLVGEFGSGGPKISLTTTSGYIDVTRH
jgi:DUF4097 and DUF4098 domain-containing protein YvlB